MNSTIIPQHKVTFDPSEDVNNRQFKCLVPEYALQVHPEHESGNLERWYDPNPHAMCITDLTIAMMIDFVTTGVGFELCEIADFPVLIRTIDRYVDDIKSINTDKAKEVVAKCKELQGGVMDAFKFLDKVGYDKFIDAQPNVVEDIFGEFK